MNLKLGQHTSYFHNFFRRTVIPRFSCYSLFTVGDYRCNKPLHYQITKRCFAKKEKSGDNKKVKNEKEKEVINKEYEHVSTEEIKKKYKLLVDSALERFKENLNEIKISKSNPKILDNILIPVKGKKFKLSELGTIMVRGANILVINPFESDHKEPIIKGVESSKLDVQISSEDNNIVVTLGAIPNDIKTENIVLIKRLMDNTKENIKTTRHSCTTEMKKLEKILGKDEGKRLETAIFEHIDK